MGEAVYLDHYLGSLGPYLEASDVTDIYINRPNELWIERFRDVCAFSPVADSVYQSLYLLREAQLPTRLEYVVVAHGSVLRQRLCL